MHVVNVLRRGGTEFGILKLMAGLGNDGFDHRICATRRAEPDFVQAYSLENVLSVAGTHREGFQFPFFRLRRIFRQYRPHIVHTRNWGAVEAIVAARLAGVPVVVHSEHGYEVSNLRGLPHRQRIFRRLTYSAADMVFTVTRELRDYHARQAWMRPERISVIFNGVDTRRFSPCSETRVRLRKEFGFADECLVVGSVGRLVPIKDYPTLLNAAEQLLHRGINLYVLLVGKGPLLESLQRQVQNSRLLSGRVLFTGASDRVPELLNAMDVFVLPSLGEGMSNTLLEAMACGLPLVATRAGGNSEIVEDGESGWLYTPARVEELADRLEHLSTHVEIRSRLGQNAREQALRQFSLDAMLQRYRDLYLDLAARRGLIPARQFSPAQVRGLRGTEPVRKVNASQKFEIAILTGSDSASTRHTVSALARLPGVEVRGLLLDTERDSWRRWRNLKRNVRREGLSHVWHRFGEAIQEGVEWWAAKLVSTDEVNSILSGAFPEQAFSLADFTRIHNIPILGVGNLNGPKAAETLRRLDVDLGVVLGTRILEASTFSTPRLGCINLHKGRVPEYRGQPAGFWEIFDARSEAGVTVHFVDQGLDTGDVVGEAVIPIHPKDTAETLRCKLDLCGTELLKNCVSELALGRAVRRPQPKSDYKPRTSPTRRQRRELEERLGITKGRQPAWLHVLKTLFYLAVYHSGVFRLVRAVHRRPSKGRGCILLYHRVNDLAHDPLTTGVERFAEHLATLRRHYPVIATSELVARVKEHKRLPGTAVAIHFDDCYRDVHTNAARLLAHLQMPACAFISSGFIDTDLVFPHDANARPVHFENLGSQEVADLARKGFEIGSHTVNHADLGQVSFEQAKEELNESKSVLESILGRSVNLVSYPYGKRSNIRPEVVDLARGAGYVAMFSAYGGYIEGHTDTFDIRRIGISGQHRPLDLLMEIEGISLSAWKYRWSAAGTRRDKAS